MTPRALVSCVLCCASLAACGGDGAEPAAERTDPPAAAPATRPAPDPVPAETSSPPPASTAPATGPATPEPPGSCGTAADLDVEVLHGEVSCADATAAVAGYDRSGPKVQEVGEFLCEGGEAAVRPVVLACASDAGEVVAREPGR